MLTNWRRCRGRNCLSAPGERQRLREISVEKQEFGKQKEVVYLPWRLHCEIIPEFKNDILASRRHTRGNFDTEILKIFEDPEKLFKRKNKMSCLFTILENNRYQAYLTSKAIFCTVNSMTQCQYFPLSLTTSLAFLQKFPWKLFLMHPH